MKYLKIKRPRNKKRADGSPIAIPIWVTRPRKYSKRTTEKNISLTSSILITGQHDSGKTRMLDRLHDEWHPIWGAKIKALPVRISAYSPITQWLDQPAVKKWHEKQKDKPSWSKLKPWEKEESLLDYIAQTQPIIFIDDAHRLTGRKLVLARQCVITSKINVTTSSSIQRIAPNFRAVIERKNPQLYNLSSDIAYDATKPILWLLTTAMVLAGWWQAALVLGGMTALSTGRRATKQD
jgi:hypothetical protein